MFREHVGRGTPLGLQAKPFMERGELVPDEMVLSMVEERIAQPDCANGFVLDGFPRTLPQAEKLDEILRQHRLREPLVMHFVVDPSAVAAAADRTAHLHGGRARFTISTIIRRRCRALRPRRRRVDPAPRRPRRGHQRAAGGLRARRRSLLVDYYRRQGVLVDVDGMAPPEAVTERVLKILDASSKR